MKWRPFWHEQIRYDLAHLNQTTVTYKQEAKGAQSERTYTVDIVFSLHCFTRRLKPGESPDADLCYGDEREVRVFDFNRYALSYHLPEVAAGLMERKCYHTGKGNFFTIEVIDKQTGSRVEYEIYFVTSRSSRKGALTLFVQSAYVRDKEHLASRPRGKSIRFHVILFNVLNKIEIKVPK